MPAKLQFSEQESSIVKDAELILTKNRIIAKLQQVFGGVAAGLQQQIHLYQPTLSEEVTLISPKISKGEQYKGLPYVMLDYPRFFSREDVFAIRTFFWWGHYCSVTLHLKGRFLKQYLPALQQNSSGLDGFKICTSGDEWNHDLQSNDYLPTTESALLMGEVEFLKIGKLLPLENWPEMETSLLQIASQLLNALQ